MKIDNEDRKLTREETQAVREWADAPAPGEAAAANFKAPKLQVKRRLPARRWMYQAAAAVLLFALGYYTGTARNAGVAEQPSAIPAQSPPPSQSPMVIASATPVAPGPVQQPPASTPTEDCPSPQLYQGSDGHFRINTTLCESGSHATWVINPKLELASAPESNLEEKQ